MKTTVFLICILAAIITKIIMDTSWDSTIDKIFGSFTALVVLYLMEEEKV